ncbi:MAG: hypothetical protein U0441_26135 [Polyangiaceae bacterium]
MKLSRALVGVGMSLILLVGLGPAASADVPPPPRRPVDDDPARPYLEELEKPRPDRRPSPEPAAPQEAPAPDQSAFVGPSRWDGALGWALPLGAAALFAGALARRRRLQNKQYSKLGAT